MKRKLKNSVRTWILLSFFTILFSVSTSQSYQNTVTFDVLFPATWYQKGLESSLSVWQTLANACEKRDGDMISFHELLGKLVFTSHCVNRMVNEGVVCLPEDSAYLGAVLDKVKELVDIFVDGGNEDVILSIHDVISTIEQLLNKTR